MSTRIALYYSFMFVKNDPLYQPNIESWKKVIQLSFWNANRKPRACANWRKSTHANKIFIPYCFCFKIFIFRNQLAMNVENLDHELLPMQSLVVSFSNINHGNPFDYCKVWILNRSRTHHHEQNWIVFNFSYLFKMKSFTITMVLAVAFFEYTCAFPPSLQESKSKLSIIHIFFIIIFFGDR